MAASLAVVRFCGSLLQNRRQPKIYSSGDRVLAVPKRSNFGRRSQSVRAAEVILHVDLKTNRASKGGVQLGGPEKLDHWMRESVVEIVRNLREAQPLLVRVYEYGENIFMRNIYISAAAEDWEGIDGRWKSGEEQSPEGIILVEELLDQYHDDHENNNNITTKKWGVLLLMMGDNNWAASYLLKTTTATSTTDSSSSGYGYGKSTHFCLVKVNTFREPVESQLRNCWLV